jgi:signal transduction histidine kinase
MTFSLRARQVAMVTTLVAGSMITLATVNFLSLVGHSLDESRTRGELLARTVFHRARLVVPDAPDPNRALREDPGIRAILESSIAYTESVTYAAIVDSEGIAIAHSSPLLEGQPHAEAASVRRLLEQNVVGQLAGIYRDATLEIDEPILLGDSPFGSIHIGLATVLIRRELQQSLGPAVTALVLTLTLGLLVSLVLARWALRPIHVIRAGLNRLGRGDPDIHLELPPGRDFSDLGESFAAISRRLTGRVATTEGAPLETVIERLEEGVAILDREGAILFANSAMKATLPEGVPPRCLVDDSLLVDHPYKRLVSEAVQYHRTSGPITVGSQEVSRRAPGQTDYVIAAHPFEDLDGQFVGVVLVTRDIGYLSSVQSTMESSRQLASLGRLLAGVAHEVKNPLNAMTIHLELIRQKLLRAMPSTGGDELGSQTVLGLRATEDSSESDSRGTTTIAGTVGTDGDTHELLQHVTTISDEVRRLDEVIQGFLRFVRPDDFQHAPVDLSELVDEVFALVGPDADRMGIRLQRRVESDLHPVTGDRQGLRQALLNLALNACQAMPDGGTLGVDVRNEGRWIVVDLVDTGAGIQPDVLERIFELYYTSKPGGSGIGLSMVYRIIKLHGGEIEVESTVGAGTRFRLMLPPADGRDKVGGEVQQP